MAWTSEALARCGCGHSPAAHEERGADGQALLLGCGVCGCQAYDPRADVAAERGAAVVWDVARRLRAANASRERLRAVALAVKEGKAEDLATALDGLRGEDLTPGDAGRGA